MNIPVIENFNDEVPTLATLGNPLTAIILEGTEGDESVVAGATTEDRWLLQPQHSHLLPSLRV
jgi:hypothetical protein